MNLFKNSILIIIFIIIFSIFNHSYAISNPFESWGRKLKESVHDTGSKFKSLGNTIKRTAVKTAGIIKNGGSHALYGAVKTVGTIKSGTSRALYGAVNTANTIGNGVIKTAHIVEKGTVKAANIIGNGTVKTVKTIKITAAKTANIIGNGVVKTANTIGKGTVNTANTIGNGTLKTVNTIKTGTAQALQEAKKVTQIIKKESDSINDKIKSEAPKIGKMVLTKITSEPVIQGLIKDGEEIKKNSDAINAAFKKGNLKEGFKDVGLVIHSTSDIATLGRLKEVETDTVVAANATNKLFHGDIKGAEKTLEDGIPVVKGVSNLGRSAIKFSDDAVHGRTQNLTHDLQNIQESAADASASSMRFDVLKDAIKSQEKILASGEENVVEGSIQMSQGDFKEGGIDILRGTSQIASVAATVAVPELGIVGKVALTGLANADTIRRGVTEGVEKTIKLSEDIKKKESLDNIFKDIKDGGVALGSTGLMVAGSAAAGGSAGNVAGKAALQGVQTGGTLSKVYTKKTTEQ